MSQESVLLAPSPPPAIHSHLGDTEDAWSRPSRLFEDDRVSREIEEVEENRDSEDITLKAVHKTDDVPALDTTLDGPSPLSGSPIEPAYDSVSMQSLPTVQVTEPQSPGPQRQSANVPSFTGSSLDDVSGSTARSVWSTAGASSPSSPRRNRPRSAIDSRSANRLSGFFSNLIHRRDPMPPHSPNSSTPRERATPTPEESVVPSRASSPIPTPRPITPPPSLPPPTLRELGLSLSVLTSNLSPSHFSTPPASGAFLAPHYLLLCHAQGLDVLPLVSPPAPQPYALIRRVSFKSVVVMEHRGVLVAIAGRRDGVRVYALEEVKKAVEWRLDVEVRRERDRARREEAKRIALIRDSGSMDLLSLESFPPLHSSKGKPVRRSPSVGATFVPTPRPPVPKKAKTPPQTPPQPPHLPPALAQAPLGPPPSYRSPSPPRRLRPQPSAISLNARDRRTSVNNVLSGTMSRRPGDTTVVGRDGEQGNDSKSDWMDAHESSDDEAINVVAAGTSGSEALDERTSSMAAVSSAPRIETSPLIPRVARPLSSATMTPSSTRRPRPADLDLSATRAIASPRPAAPPSPTPTLVTLRQTLASSHSSGGVAAMASLDSRLAEPPTPDGDGDDDDEQELETGGRTPTNERISFAQMLQESRIPDLPPPGTRREQQAILITESHPVATGEEDMPGSPTSTNAPSHRTRQSQETQVSKRRRRRWSVLDGIFQPGSSSSPNLPSQPEHGRAQPPLPLSDLPAVPQMRERRAPLSRSQSSTFHSSSTQAASPPRSSPAPPRPSSSPSEPPTERPISTAPTPAHSRFLSRIISSAFARRSEDHVEALQQQVEHIDNGRRGLPGSPAPHAPAPKLEYVKLPGTKNSMMIKAVETSKKSFLAILCGENGEKVELFAGTYRTALGLSRTFILPDSPRSLELQLQGDDLVEVFLVFSQNVFGLEPATVRVREVRLGRAERRAARRRARELQSEDPQASGAEIDSVPTEDTRVSITVGLATPPTTATAESAVQTGAAPPTPSATTSSMPVDATNPLAKTDDAIAFTTAAMGPYTTFQQLSFAPNFPLASIADDYVIPPTYPDFLQYRSVHEPGVDGNGDVDLSQVQFSPPGLPLPPAAPPSKWYYRDPKSVIHGPWKSSLMQAWYRDGLLPPDLPVRREEETEYTLLKDLRQHSVDPTQPFGTSSSHRPLTGEAFPVVPEAGKPLLSPISLLTQSRIFGPPALFYSSRGGHSTAIVDGRGRSVLKDRFVWSPDELDDDAQPVGRLGDVKRLEAFDVKDRSVLVAMRQGGFEAVDLSDALLRPADASRSTLPHFTTTQAQINRRGPFTWRIGMPVSSPLSGPTSLLPLKSPHHNSHRLPAPVKKLSTGPGKSPARPEFTGDVDSEHTRDEVIFLGRRDDAIYICERNGGAFRVLRLSPIGAS